MGIENRDYSREGDYTGTLAGWGLDYIPPVVKWLIAANVVVFVLQIFLTRTLTPADIQLQWDQLPPASQAAYREWDRDNAQAANVRQSVQSADPAPAVSADQSNRPATSFVRGLSAERVSLVHEWLALKTSKVIRGQVWRLLTSAFCHDNGGLFHILFNMLALYWFGVTLESMLGGREFLLFYLTAAIFSGLASVGLDLYLDSDVPAIGASGAVMAVLMLYAIHYPRNTIRIFWFFPLEVRWVVILYILFDLYPVLQALAGNPAYHDGIGHAAHLGGLAFGFVYWKLNLNIERYWEMLPKWRGSSLGPRRAGTRAARRSPQRQLEDQVDDILAKISQSGEASLTEHERRVLQQASERYKRKHQ